MRGFASVLIASAAVASACAARWPPPLGLTIPPSVLAQATELIQ